MRVGVLTGGGDCPGLNAVIRAVVRRGVTEYGYEFVGFRDGWKGPLEGLTMPLGITEVRGILPRGGTILGSSRTNPVKIDGGIARIKENLASLGIDALIAIGGEDTLGVATALTEQGLQVVGVPKTIDNDLPLTDHCPGFGSVAKHIGVTIRETALDNAAMGQNDFVSILEVMGRNAGWLAASSVLAHRRDKTDDRVKSNTHYNCTAPHIVLLPEVPFNPDAFITRVQEVLKAEKHCFVVVSEGVQDAAGNYLGADTSSTDAFGHAVLGGAGEYLRNLVEDRFSGVKARASKLGITQRAASHNASKTDVEEAELCGAAAVRAALAGESGQMVTMVRSGKEAYAVETRLAPLTEIANGVKAFPPEWIGEDRMSVSPDFVKYALPLIQGEMQLPFEQGLPRYAQISLFKVQRRLEPHNRG